MKPADPLANSLRSPAAPGGIVIAGMRVDAGNYDAMTARIMEWTEQSQSRYVCIANVHMVMEAYDSPSFRQIVNSADMVTSDGMPLVWLLRRRGYPQAERVYGPTLMLHVCAAAAAAGVSIGLFGGTPELLSTLTAKLHEKFPDLKIDLQCAPPFGELMPQQNEEYAKQIREAAPRILFVGLGCPKQERWMAAMQAKIPAVLLGVGAAFNFHSGHVRQSPAWLQRMGLEWLFRLLMEPRRLWKRYTWHNGRFIGEVIREEFFHRARKYHQS